MRRNLSICHKCERRQCDAGQCHCDADNEKRNVVAMANAAGCPLGLHDPNETDEPLPVPVPTEKRPEMMALPRERWPMMARLLATLAIDADLGLGDTLDRLIARIGGDRYKRIYLRLMGEDCGCEARRMRMNTRYPLR